MCAISTWKTTFGIFQTSGKHATYFAGRTIDPAINLKKVTFFPQVSYYPAGGASVQHFGVPGPITLSPPGPQDRHLLAGHCTGRVYSIPRTGRGSQIEATISVWPVTLTHLKVSHDEFLSAYSCNHTHGTVGDWVDDLVNIVQILGIEAKVCTA